MRTIAALYIDLRGPYPRMPGVDCWDAGRDARGYDGPHPVIAHPPCGPWGAFAHMASKQTADCAVRAVAQVRAFGGVLEHPSGSRLWEHIGLPLPGDPPDAFWAFTVEVNQCEWGHVAQKRTWLYCVGISPAALEAPPYPGRSPTHRIARDRRMADPARGLLECSAEQRRRTPVAFAEYLVRLARAAQPPLTGRPRFA